MTILEDDEFTSVLVIINVNIYDLNSNEQQFGSSKRQNEGYKDCCHELDFIKSFKMA
ncbi:12892_t:CDS:2 [Cetraspora pellucida]|uniref:12892_t:CDS:1 n=1 Tax=Cetraspora pellucida TaxID=1433469 RepID=A0A9N8VV97_9GLOM|nr:12892_t:CDS:2 [Cetraspora pellucida]